MVEMALKVFLFVVIWLLISPTVETAKCSAMPKRPLVMAHRGSSGVLPENTIEAFERAISDGADVLECDVTLSMDLVPICLHEELLQVTTDVANRAEFRDRYGSITVLVNGNPVTLEGWFAFNFTVAELKTLRKHQPLDFRDHTFDGLYTIPTLQEFIDVAKSASRKVIINPEIKNPTQINTYLLHSYPFRFEDIVLQVFENNGYRTADDPCLIDCFDEQSLLYFKNRTKLRLNIDILESVSDDRLAEWSKSFYGVGTWINIIAPHFTLSEGYKNWLGNTTDFVARAHAHGLKVFAYTVANEDRYLAWDFEQDVHNAFRFWLSQQVDGIYVDFPKSLTWYLDRNVTKASGVKTKVKAARPRGQGQGQR